MSHAAHVINPDVDNIATLIGEVKAGEVVEAVVKGEKKRITVRQDIPYGHKVAIEPIKRGEAVYKYGLSIGAASKDIGEGDYVHIHNIESLRAQAGA